jgi:methionyl aminopeptidase
VVHLRSRSEIDHIRESSRIVADLLERLSEMIKPGVTPRELDTEAEKFIHSRGAVPSFKGLYGFPASLCISVNAEVVHGIPGDKPFVEGEIVGIDVGALKNGYHGDHARTFTMGEVSQDVQKLVDTTRECLDRAVAAAVPDATLGDIGNAVQSHAESRGYGVVKELVGHGIGTKLHEEPQIPNYGHAGKGLTIKEGMCFALEPMINMGTDEIITSPDGWTVVTVDGKPSAHFEHTIAITAKGPEVLTDYGSK